MQTQTLGVQVQQTSGSREYRLASAAHHSAVHPGHAAYQSAALLQELTAHGSNAPPGSRLQLETRGALSFPTTSDAPGETCSRGVGNF